MPQIDYSPVSTGITARHWRALLFLVALSSGFEKARRDNRDARRRVWNPVSIRVEPNLFDALRIGDKTRGALVR